MSLKESDWKTVLDKPKNVGLKAGGGTGISELLRKCDQAEKKYKANFLGRQGVRGHGEGLQGPGARCDTVVAKNKAFSEACSHLKKVKESRGAPPRRLSSGEKELRRQGGLQAQIASIWNDMIQCFQQGGGRQGGGRPRQGDQVRSGQRSEPYQPSSSRSTMMSGQTPKRSRTRQGDSQVADQYLHERIDGRAQEGQDASLSGRVGEKRRGRIVLCAPRRLRRKSVPARRSSYLTGGAIHVHLRASFDPCGSRLRKLGWRSLTAM